MTIPTTQEIAEALKPRKRAIIYCRVSTDKQKQDGESLEYQEEKCRQWAELHEMDVIVVFLEAKSGYIHYSLREKLTLARQMVRDGLADGIIVWDLRRFSRNFVHSAMIFEEIESAGGEIISVSENIDNSLTGKLIRSILAWSAESEREKILEYANRYWQTRLAQELPIATGQPLYGWQWANEEKTKYMLNKEEAAVRISIFKMFTELEMSLRAIAHKLMEDGILPPARVRKIKGREGVTWHPGTIRKILMDPENVGILTLCKTTNVMSDTGKKRHVPNEKKKVVLGLVPAIVTVETYDQAQYKLQNNPILKSNEPKQNAEDFLLKGHVICKTCGYRMGSKNKQNSGHVYAYYHCTKNRIRYDSCPSQTQIRTDNVNQVVWENCCRVFERIEAIRDSIESNIEEYIKNMLEDSTGKQLILELEEGIKLAKKEREQYQEGTYLYNLISQDISDKEEKIRRHEEEHAKSRSIVKLSATYQESIMGFLNFLHRMKGKYHEATFKDKRNALEVLGVKVYLYPLEEVCIQQVDAPKEWLTIKEAARLTGIPERTIQNNIKSARLKAESRCIVRPAIHQDELARFVEVRWPGHTFEKQEGELFLINQAAKAIGTDHQILERAIKQGLLEAQTMDIFQRFIHRDELNRFLRESPVRLRSERHDVEPRIEITYTPRFAGVMDSL